MSEKTIMLPAAREEVALKLTTVIWGREYEGKFKESGKDFRKFYLDLYAECYQAASGYRD